MITLQSDRPASLSVVQSDQFVSAVVIGNGALSLSQKVIRSSIRVDRIRVQGPEDMYEIMP